MKSLIALALLLTPALRAQPQTFDAPACSGTDHELADRSFFVLCYDASRKTPVWVGYQLTPDHLQRLASRPSHFRQDRELSRPGASNADYTGSGFDRGHMAPAADFAWSDAAIRSTFLLSNVVPQRGSVNSGRWAQFEAAVRGLVSTAASILVFTGPLFESQVECIGRGCVAVPSHTYKVILLLEGNRKTMFTAIMPNTGRLEKSLDAFAVTVDEVERRTGLDFFAALDDADEEQLESTLRLIPGATHRKATVR